MMVLNAGNQGIALAMFQMRVLRPEEDDTVTSVLASARDPPVCESKREKKGRGLAGLLLGRCLARAQKERNGLGPFGRERRAGWLGLAFLLFFVRKHFFPFLFFFFLNNKT